MKTATVRELRNRFALISRWIEEGEQVTITKRGRVFARIVPHTAAKRRKLQMPDFVRRIERVFGRTKLTPRQSAELREYMKGDR
jgi:prevent-host-death family protein